MSTDVDRSATPDSTTRETVNVPGSRTDRAEPTREHRGSGIMWSGVAVVVVMALLVIVAFQNAHDVRFDFLWLGTSIPLILILAITFGIALVTTETVGFVWRHRRREHRREHDELRRLRQKA